MLTPFANQYTKSSSGVPKACRGGQVFFYYFCLLNDISDLTDCEELDFELVSYYLATKLWFEAGHIFKIGFI